MRIRRPLIYAAVAAAAIATAGLLASPAMASTTPTWQGSGPGFSLSNSYGNARGTTTAHQYGQWGRGSVTLSGTVSSYGRDSGNRQMTIEEVFLSSSSGPRGQLIGSAGPGQSSRFSGSLYNSTRGTITLCAANQRGGNVRDCTSRSLTVSVPAYHLASPHPSHPASPHNH
jgi:hypothetical protein